MTSEWMRVMLDEIARKQEEARAARLELERRTLEGLTAGGAQPSAAHHGPDPTEGSPARPGGIAFTAHIGGPIAPREDPALDG